MTRPVIALSPAPQDLDVIFRPEALAALRAEFDVQVLDPDDPRADEVLVAAFAVVGQLDLPRQRLERASALRAVLNVEGNFYPNVDYETCFARGIHVLGCGPAYADAVAEYGLALALDLARGISRADRAFRAGTELYVSAGNQDCVLLRGSNVGLLGFGNLARALLPLLAPFRPTVRAFDPWLPPAVVSAAGVRPASLDETVSTSEFLFVLATVTEESRHLLDARTLALLPDRARIVVISRASVVDFGALRAEIRSGRLTAAIDVWPQEPMPADEPLRHEDGALLSAHRAGGIPAAYAQIGDMVLDDLRQIARGLPPVRMQVAARELVGRYRNRPVASQSRRPAPPPVNG